MKELFKGYYRPTQEEFDNLWSECIFVFDTNVLFKFYRYSEATRGILLDIFSRFAERLWIPHQVALEFHYNRLTVISDQEQAYAKVRDPLSKIIPLLNSIGNQHPFINDLNIIDPIKNNIEAWLEELVKAETEHPNLLNQDTVLGIITDLFEGKTGDAYSQEKLIELFKDGEARYEKEKPPGFKDKSKKEFKIYNDTLIKDAYGDFIIWSQIIDKANEGGQPKPVIFVTDDVKEDWWLGFKGKIIGPRPELALEFKHRVGTQFYMYQTEHFMEYAKTFLDLQEQGSTLDDAIEEVRTISQYDKNTEKEKLLEELFPATLTGLSEEMKNYKPIEISGLSEAMKNYKNLDISGLSEAMKNYKHVEISGLSEAMKSYNKNLDMSGLSEAMKSYNKNLDMSGLSEAMKNYKPVEISGLSEAMKNYKLK
jgi:hypothetical protein